MTDKIEKIADKLQITKESISLFTLEHIEEQLLLAEEKVTYWKNLKKEIKK